MEAQVKLDELYVISDLHMGGDPGFQIFSHGPLLARVIDDIRKRPVDRQVGLCINGDMVDFLAEPDAACFDPAGAVEKLKRIEGREAFKQVWTALRDFVGAQNRTLTITLGNHDLELALPWVRESLLDLLSGSDSAARGRIRLAFDGIGFTCRVGRANVLCVHGNDVDPWNYTNYEQLRRIGCCAAEGRSIKDWTPNAGSKMVVGVMNRLKKKYPFVDLLKPETDGAVPIVIAMTLNDGAFGDILDALRALPEVFGRWTRGKLRSWIPFLSEAGVEVQDHDIDRAAARRFDNLIHRSLANVPTEAVGLGDDVWSSRMERWLRDGVEPLALLGVGEREKLSLASYWASRLRGIDAAESLRRSLKDLVDDRSFDLSASDDTYREMDQQIGSDVHFVVTGHTHLERALRRNSSQSFYFNTGAWVRLIQLSPSVLRDDLQFKRAYEAIHSGERSRLEEAGLITSRPAVARIISQDGKVIADLCRAHEAGDLLAPLEKTQFTLE